MRLALLALLMLAPSALALDAFPEETTLGRTEARLRVRLPEGGPLRVEAEPPVEVALAGGASVPTPATLAVPADATWHGLSGVVEVVVRREKASEPVTLMLSDGTGAGVAYEWPAQRETPQAPAVAVLAVALVAAHIGRSSWRARLSRRTRRRIVSPRLPMWLLTMRTLPSKRSVSCSGLWPKR